VPLQSLQLVGLTGGAQDLDLKDLQGQVVVVNFWGTWCPPCQAEFPHMVELHKNYAARSDFRLLAVSCGPPGQLDRPDDLKLDTQAFLDRHGVQLPTYADPDSISREAVRAAVGFTGYPTTILLDRQGTIRRVWVGYQPGTEKEISAAVEELLERA
jgi:thiol-disulfide isomerase/thioredoxin